MNKYIVVNATAMDRCGALSILRQFVDNIPLDNRKWLLLISPEISIQTDNPNVRLEPVKGVKARLKRIWWDAVGLKKWLKENKIEPLAIFSLHNTSCNGPENVPNFIYYEQSIPFNNFRWNPFKKKERTIWLYKNFYPFFVKLFLKRDTVIFVQLEYVKDEFAKMFNHPKELIHVCSPTILAPKVEIKNSTETSGKPRMIFPARADVYKNHRVVEEALKFTDADVEILFTTDEKERKVSDERIKHIGLQPYEKIFQLYQNCDALIFPSYMETFGLPLIEAAMTGLAVIAPDLPYARELLRGYDGAVFVGHKDPQGWAKAIEKIEKGKRYRPIDISNRPGWKELFENITYK